MPPLTRQSRITSDPDVLGGEPVIRGRLITVARIADFYFARGWEVEDIAAAHGLTLGDVDAALAYFVAQTSGGAPLSATG